MGHHRAQIWQYAKFPHWPFQVIRPWVAEFAALLGEQAAYLIHTPEVAVTEALQPVADFRFELCAPNDGRRRRTARRTSRL
jgi:hypothetical protein